MLPTGIEPVSQASEARGLSISLREQTSAILALNQKTMSETQAHVEKENPSRLEWVDLQQSLAFVASVSPQDHVELINKLRADGVIAIPEGNDLILGYALSFDQIALLIGLIEKEYRGILTLGKPTHETHSQVAISKEYSYALLTSSAILAAARKHGISSSDVGLDTDAWTLSKSDAQDSATNNRQGLARVVGHKKTVLTPDLPFNETYLHGGSGQTLTKEQKEWLFSPIKETQTRFHPDHMLCIDITNWGKTLSDSYTTEEGISSAMDREYITKTSAFLDELENSIRALSSDSSPVLRGNRDGDAITLYLPYSPNLYKQIIRVLHEVTQSSPEIQTKIALLPLPKTTTISVDQSGRVLHAYTAPNSYEPAVDGVTLKRMMEEYKQKELPPGSILAATTQEFSKKLHLRTLSSPKKRI